MPLRRAAGRKALLLGTALVSAGLLGIGATPAHAVQDCTGDIGTGPDPIIFLGIDDEIDCVNTEARTGEAPDFMAIGLSTINADHAITLDTEGLLQSVNAAGDAFGIYTQTVGANSFIDIENRGDTNVTTTGFAGDAYGIFARAGTNSPIGIFNSGNVRVETDGANANAAGIDAHTTGTNSAITIVNRGDVSVASNGDDTASLFVHGIDARTQGGNSPITVVNHGDLEITTTGDGGNFGSKSAYGIETRTRDGSNSVHNSGDVKMNATEDSTFLAGIRTFTSGDGNPSYVDNRGHFELRTEGEDSAVVGIFASTSDALDLRNTGDLTIETMGDDSGVQGLLAFSGGGDEPVRVHNSGDLEIKTAGERADAEGIYGYAGYGDRLLSIQNSGDFKIATTGDRADAYGIRASTGSGFSPISIDNSGRFDVKTEGDGARAFGIRAIPRFSASPPSRIRNSGDMWIETEGDGSPAYGIFSYTRFFDNPLSLYNSGDFWVETAGDSPAFGIRAFTFPGGNSPLTIHNSGNFALKTGSDGARAFGIDADTQGGNSPLIVSNSGAFALKTDGAGADASGIEADTDGEDSDLGISNSGDFWLETSGFGGFVDGIEASTRGDNSHLGINNSGDFRLKTAGTGGLNDGIDADTYGNNSFIAIHNSGDFRMETRGDGANSDGLDAGTRGNNSFIAIRNSGNFWLKTSGYDAYTDGFQVYTRGNNSRIDIHNSGDFWVEKEGDSSQATANGMLTSTRGDGSALEIHNSGDFRVTSRGADARTSGIKAETGSYYLGTGAESPLKILNGGDIWVTAEGDGSPATGIDAYTYGANSHIGIWNNGDLRVETGGPDDNATGIVADTRGENSPITIHNFGAVYAAGGAVNTGIVAYSRYANPTTIKNSGTIGAESHFAIDVNGAGTAKIYNEGTITGFVDLTDQDDVFINERGGVFEAKQTSLFGEGDDLFKNEEGGTVQAATDGTRSEITRFVHLETFKNEGLISMIDGRQGDAFIISNTPGGTDLDFKAWGDSTLGVDAFLGGPGSKSDTFTIEGNVSGKTKVIVNNTNPGGGVFNDKGIPVVFADGATPDAGAFRLANGPIDAGLFNYDLFFEETNSGQWELRSFPGADAHLLPQLVTAAQDLWHQSSNTWFDRTADLRVLLHNDAVLVPTGDKSLGATVQPKFTPAAWLKTGGQWLDRDANAQTKAYGRTYNYNLDRELESFDLQAGIDFGSRGVMNPDDALVFGILGGFVYGDLSYDNLARNFDYSGGQVGVYATYLNGGLFVDTLLNVHIYDIDASTRGFPGSIDGNTVGLRTDTGYRFGSFSGGLFIEPLATLEVMWVDLDGFSNGGNRISFDDEANVRGRLGLRAGTTGQFMENVLWEPFVIGSVWGNLSDDNAATIVSAGRTFRFVDDRQDVWGEVSAGVNFFNLSKSISVFSKVDVSFGDDLTGIGGQGGMRVAW